MASIVKTPAVIDNYYVDFAAQIGPGETLASPAVTAFDYFTQKDVSSQIIGTPAPSISGSQVIFWYQGGVAGKHYVISVKAATSAGRELEADVDLFVEEEVTT